MADNIAGGHVDRGGAGVGGERGGGTETIDCADPAEDLARGQRADTAQLGQSGAGVGDCGLDVGGGLGDAAVQLAYLSDQIYGEAAQGFAGCIAGPDPAEEFGGPFGGEVTLRACRDEVGEDDVEAVDGLGAGFDQVVAVSTIARRAVTAPSTAAEFNLRALRAAIPTLTASASSFLRPWPVTASVPGRRVSREHRRRRCRRCVAALSAAHPGRMRLRSPMSGRATGPRSGAVHGSRRG